MRAALALPAARRRPVAFRQMWSRRETGSPMTAAIAQKRHEHYRERTRRRRRASRRPRRHKGTPTKVYTLISEPCDRACPKAVPIHLHLGDPAREDRYRLRTGSIEIGRAHV